MWKLDKVLNITKDNKHRILNILGIKMKFRRKSRNSNNNVSFGNNVVEYCREDKKRISLDLNNCNGNIIKIGKLATAAKGSLHIICYCDNCEITIGENLYIATDITITIGLNHPNGGKINNAKFNMGKNCSVEQMYALMRHSNSSIIIGDDCLISFGINIWHTDAHPIFSKETGKIVNFAKELIIGRHCWLGGNVTILKNSKIAPNSIIGWGAVVRGSFKEENSVIVGNPAIAIDTASRGGYNWQASVVPAFTNNEDD